MSKPSIFKHFISIGTGTVINMLIGFLTTPILTRLVGTAEYGQYSIFTMYASIALMILCMGFDQALIRYFYRFDTPDYQRTIVRECCVLPLVCTLLTGTVVNALSWLGVVRFEFEPGVMTMLTISVLFQVMNRIDLILLRVTYQTKLYSMLQVMTKLLFAGIAIAVCFWFQTQKLFVLTAASAVSYGVVTVIGITFSKKSYLQIIVSAAACATNIVGNTLLVPVMGGVGAAISTGLSYIVFFAMRTILSNKYFPMKWGIGEASIITLLFLVYAWYNTFHSFGMVTVLGYVVIFVIIVYNYRDVIRDVFHLLKKKFS